MAVPITSGGPTNIDSVIPSGGSNRQIVTIGSPTTVAGVAEVDASFGLEVQVAAQQAAATSGAITTSTTTVAAAATGFAAATITISGTYAGVAIVFEISDNAGTTYFPFQVQRETDGQVLTADTLATNASVAYTADLAGVTNIRVRATAFTSGSAAVRITPGGMAFMPVVSIGNKDSLNGTYSSVAGTVSVNTTILAVNVQRRGAAVFNDSTATLFLGLSNSSAESATAFTVKVAPGGYFEAPFGFTGRIAGHWTAAAGSARVTEFTA